MANVDDIIEEIVSDLRKYDDAGLIDKNKIYRDIVFATKKFGNDICTLQETVLEVKNTKAELSPTFFSLYAAYLCEPKYYKPVNIEINHLQQSYFFRERVEYSSSWNECESCCENKTEKIIRENLYFNEGHVQFTYQNPRLLTLGKSMVKNNCHRMCRNFGVRDNPNEITINGTTLDANFLEGYIYIQYYGLPTDEHGRLDIPETKNGHFETYLEYYAKRRLAERLMGNNDAIGLQNLYSVYKNEELVSLKNASGNLKMSKIDPTRFRTRMRRLNRSETLAYEATNLEHVFGGSYDRMI